ncbi:MAG: hypothetical protein AB9897_05405 [Anaerolineaceae bacterium]
MLPQNQKIIDALKNQLTNAIKLRDRRKKLDLENTLQKINTWLENPGSQPPDLRMWGYTLEVPTSESQILPELPEDERSPVYNIEDLPLPPQLESLQLPEVDSIAKEMPAIENEPPAQVGEIPNQDLQTTESVLPLAENNNAPVVPPIIEAVDSEVEPSPAQDIVEEEPIIEAPVPTGQLVNSSAGRRNQLEVFYKAVPEDLSKVNNEELANLIKSLDDLENRKTAFPNVDEEEWNLLEEAINRLTTEKQDRLKKAYADIARKIESGDLEEASSLVHNALNLAENDPKLLDFLQHCASKSQTEKEIKSWRLALQEFDHANDHVVLKQIIDRLRIPFREGRFPDDLNEKFLQAQEHLEQLRRSSSLQTSRMRLGSLAEKKKAHDYWNEIAGQTSMAFDGVADQAIADLLTDSRRIWEDESRLAMNSVFDAANVYTATNPEVALSVLEERVGKPEESSEKKTYYAKDDLTRFNEFYAEVKTRADKQKQARAIINDLDAALDAFDRLLKIVKAKGIFPEFEKIDDLIAAETPGAAQALLMRIERLTKHAKSLAELRKYRSEVNSMQGDDSVERCLQSAQTQISLWPKNIAVPAEIQKISESLKNLFEQYDAQEQKYLRLIQKINNIKTLASQGSTQKAFFELNLIQGKAEYVDFKEEVAEVEQTLNGLRSIDEQVEIIQDQANQENPDWKSIFELSGPLLKKINNSSPLFKIAARLHAQSETSLRIAVVKRLIREKNIAAAKDQLNLQGMSDPIVQQLLRDEIETIHEAESNTPAMETIFLKARKVYSSGTLSALLSAYQLYRYIAGLPGELEGDEELPPYKLSKVTYEAIGKSKEIESLLLQHLAEIRKAKESGVASSQLKNLYGYSVVLRKANLVTSESDLKLCDWVEEEYFGALEEQLLGDGKIDEVIKNWEEVKKHSYSLGERRLLNARIVWAIKNSTIQGNLGKFEEALAAMSAIKGQARGDPRFDIELSEVYRKLYRFDEAIAAVLSDPRCGTLEKSLNEWIIDYSKRRQWLFVQKRIHDFTVNLEELVSQLHECKKNYSSVDNEIRADCIEKASEVSDKVSSIYQKIKEDEEVCQDREFKQKWQNLNLRIIELLKILFVEEDKIDPASSLNLLIFLKSVQTEYDSNSKESENSEDSKTDNPIKAHISAHPDLIGQIITSIEARSDQGRIQQLIIQHKLWLRNIAGFLSTDPSHAEKQSLLRRKGELSNELTTFHRLQVLIQSLQEDKDWKESTEKFDSELPMAIDSKIEMMNSFNLPRISEVIQINKKYADWKKALLYLSGVVATFNSLINSRQAEVISEELNQHSIANQINSLINFDYLKQKVTGLTLNADEYSLLYDWFSPKVHIVFEPNHAEVKGWSEVRAAAEKFIDNIRLWQAWEKDFLSDCQNIEGLKDLPGYLNKDLPFQCKDEFIQCLNGNTSFSFSTRVNLQNWVNDENYGIWIQKFPSLMNKNNEPVTLSKEMVGKVPFNYRIYVLEDYSRCVKTLIKFYQDGPDVANGTNVDTFLQMSNFSKMIFENCRRHRLILDGIETVIERDLETDNNEILKLGGFPSDEDLRKLLKAGVGAKSTLLVRMKAAEAIGPQNKSDWDAYNFIYIELHNTERTGTKVNKKQNLKDIVEKVRDDLGL